MRLLQVERRRITFSRLVVLMMCLLMPGNCLKRLILKFLHWLKISEPVELLEHITFSLLSRVYTRNMLPVAVNMLLQAICSRQ